MSTNLAINIEKIKKDKNGIDVLADIYFYAVFGERVSAEDLERFKWYGKFRKNQSIKHYF